MNLRFFQQRSDLLFALSALALLMSCNYVFPQKWFLDHRDGGTVNLALNDGACMAMAQTHLPGTRPELVNRIRELRRQGEILAIAPGTAVNPYDGRLFHAGRLIPADSIRHPLDADILVHHVEVLEGPMRTRTGCVVGEDVRAKYPAP